MYQNQTSSFFNSSTLNDTDASGLQRDMRVIKLREGFLLLPNTSAESFMLCLCLPCGFYRTRSYLKVL